MIVPFSLSPTVQISLPEYSGIAGSGGTGVSGVTGADESSPVVSWAVLSASITFPFSSVTVTSLSVTTTVESSTAVPVRTISAEISITTLTKSDIFAPFAVFATLTVTSLTEFSARTSTSAFFVTERELFFAPSAKLTTVSEESSAFTGVSAFSTVPAAFSSTVTLTGSSFSPATVTSLGSLILTWETAASFSTSILTAGFAILSALSSFCGAISKIPNIPRTTRLKLKKSFAKTSPFPTFG